ncbi:DUF485 domain-containing protein [Sapientia aquatica]|jgi:uncharacterized membrane protein (DUF485 family)|uniref:DUF485 domain-containing protein n=1 Tax=Sapientia aquatica TaxID=1549640 RepID=A0A4R5W0B0_9BURK|nr:DUF485 domain-containing protein [Sapientia aquatica]TDK65361.1 DUF485 domain-containing protein [Sapientia aquatica]
MEDDLVKKILANPNYQQLVKARTSYGWLFTLLVMIVYYGFIALIAFDKQLLSTRFGDGVMTIGMPIGLFVIAFTVIITGIYVRRANNQFDELTEKLKAEVLK